MFSWPMAAERNAALIPGAPPPKPYTPATPGLLSSQLDAGLFPRPRARAYCPTNAPPAGRRRKKMLQSAMASDTVSRPWVLPSPVEPALGLGALVVGIAAGV